MPIGTIREWAGKPYIKTAAGWRPKSRKDHWSKTDQENLEGRDMKIQGLDFKKGDKFQVGNDSSVYTFINVTTNEKYGFKELNAENEFDSISSFRIDNMVEHGLIISKL